MAAAPWLLVLIPLAYLAGSIPFGLLVGLSRGVDPRKAGSGNIGATNVGRLLGGKYFALVFALDVLKGLIPTAAAGAILNRARSGSPQWTDLLLWLAVGSAAILGHTFSVFLGFRGGKGVATSSGVALGIFPFYTIPGLIAMAVWGMIFKVTGYVSLASIIAAILFPLAYLAVGSAMKWPLFSDQLPLLIFASLIAVLIVLRHRTNIVRLRAGTENRFARRL
jgi:acyl phosphate:glycerol-3-phosphate acyltransferase